MTDEEEGYTYFRIKDFEGFLKKNKLFEYKSHKIAQRLREVTGESCLLRIKGRVVRLWKVPAFENGDIELSTQQFQAQESPF